MAGEDSKKIGEWGEKIVRDFLGLINWSPPVSGYPLVSSNPEEHGQTTTGVDYLFSYVSPLISDCLENIVISSKFTKGFYPTSPKSLLKQYIINISNSIESYKLSDIRSENMNQYTDIDSVADRGVIFWLSNQPESWKLDLIDKVSTIDPLKDTKHDGIFLMDNKRVKFISDAIQSARSNSINNSFNFVYFNTGQNSSNSSPRLGDIMPVHYLASSILPLRVVYGEERSALHLYINESFSDSVLMNAIGFAKRIGSLLQSSTVLYFYDYDALIHGAIVSLVFQRSQITDRSNFSVRAINPTFNFGDESL